MDFGQPNEKPTAICLVRAEVSGPHAPRHAMEVQRHAERLGYLHLYTARPPADATDPVGYALGLAASLNVDAMVVYDLETVGNTPSQVCEMFHLETVCPPATWAANLPSFSDPEHSHPQQPLTADTAHQIMQQHKNCRAVECPRKASAYSCLVREGKIVPPVDSPRERAAARGPRFRPRRTNDAPLPDGVNLEILLDVLGGLADNASVGKR